MVSVLFDRQIKTMNIHTDNVWFDFSITIRTDYFGNLLFCNKVVNKLEQEPSINLGSGSDRKYQKIPTPVCSDNTNTGTGTVKTSTELGPTQLWPVWKRKFLRGWRKSCQLLSKPPKRNHWQKSLSRYSKPSGDILSFFFLSRHRFLSLSTDKVFTYRYRLQVPVGMMV